MIFIIVWLLHCHIDFHAEVGMAVILKIGDYNQMAKVPKGFPTCYDYKTQEMFDEQKSKALSINQMYFLILIIIVIIQIKIL